MEIKETKEYEKFRFTKLNRKIDMQKVQRFTVECSKKPHLMEMCPILVNSKMEIIDGQHRFLACKQCALPIYYIQSEIIDYEDIIILNKDQKSWSLEDYISHHASRPNIHFIKLLEFSREFGLSISLSCVFLGFNRRNLIGSIKTGSLIYPENDTAAREKVRMTVDLIASFASNEAMRKRAIFSYSFYESIAHLESNLDFPRFFSNLKQKIQEIIPARSWVQYQQQFKILGIL
jgi:hypothetical protein